jgi:hypothetical protein
VAETLFGADGDDGLLIGAYQRQGRTLDDLPYTPQFEALYLAMYGGDPADEVPDRAAVFHRLHNLRKAGRLPRMGRAQTRPPRIDAEQERLLVDLVTQAVGALSKRDQLLYTPAFDTLVTRFNSETGLSLSPHSAWRIIAKLAK